MWQISESIKPRGGRKPNVTSNQYKLNCLKGSDEHEQVMLQQLEQQKRSQQQQTEDARPLRYHTQIPKILLSQLSQIVFSYIFFCVPPHFFLFARGTICWLTLLSEFGVKWRTKFSTVANVFYFRKQNIKKLHFTEIREPLSCVIKFIFFSGVKCQHTFASSGAVLIALFITKDTASAS